MSDINITRFSEAFLDAVEHIEQTCFSTPWSREMLKNELENSTSRFFVALKDEKAVGYAGMYSVCGECYIANVGVLDEYRRQGIATRLLKTLEDSAIRENAEFITLEVRESNMAAVALYSENGYVKVGLRKNYYSKPTESAVLMTKFLKQTDMKNF